MVVAVVMVVMMVVVVVGIGRKEGRECKRLVFLFSLPAGRTLTAARQGTGNNTDPATKKKVPRKQVCMSKYLVRGVRVAQTPYKTGA